MSLDDPTRQPLAGAPLGLRGTRDGPPKVDGREKTARLLGQSGGEPFEEWKRCRRLPRSSPGPENRTRRQRRTRFGKQPLTATPSAARQAGGGQSPTRPKTPAGPEQPQRRGRAVPLLCGLDGLARETPAPHPATPPSPPNRPRRRRKVLESLRGRPAPRGALPWCTRYRGWAWATAGGAGTP